LAGVLPDVPGPLCLGHPTMCRLLSKAATEAGARVLRGVEGITLGAVDEDRRGLRFTHDGETYDVRPRMVVGADGRGSPIRKHAGIELHRDPTHHLFAGLLIEGADDWPATVQSTTQPAPPMTL